MDNDKVERALNDFISDEDKKLQKLIDTLERIEKAGTLDKLFECAEEPSFMEKFTWGHSWHDSDDFRETLQDYELRTGQELQKMYEHLRRAKFFHRQAQERYQDLKSRESEIKNPILIKFIKDYEAYYVKKEDEKMAKKWKAKGAIKSKLLPIEIATNDYWEASDDDGNPMVVDGKKRYFTYDEAIVIKADGWRLPTRAEWAALYVEFGEKDGDIDPSVLTKALRLSENGYANSSLRGGGDYGYYWSSTADHILDSAYVLYFYSCFVDSSTNVPYDCGLSVRLVRDVEEDKWIETVKVPLIKDEKIRKAVRAWAEANGYGKDEKYEFNGFEDASWKSWSLINYGNGSNNNEIEFNGGIDFKRAEDGSYYTIAELCGEEEE